MSDAPESQSKRITMLKVSGRDFARFLESKLGPDDRCQVCGSDVWTIFSPGPDDIFRLGLTVRNQEKPFFVSTFGYHCDNCGYVRTHHAATVHKWVVENPAPPVGDEGPAVDIDSDTKDE